MTSPEIHDLVRKELLDNPIIDQLGLTEDHFHGAMLAAGEKLASGRADEALQDYATLVLTAPQSVAFQIGLAEAAAQTGQFELALQAASFVMSAAPERPEGYLLSGKACLGMGETDLAREDFTDAVALAEASSDYKATGQIAKQFLAMVSAD